MKRFRAHPQRSALNGREFRGFAPVTARAPVWVIGLALLAAARAAWCGGVDVLTFHGDRARLGWNRKERLLTPASVSSGAFGKLWERPLDGQIYGAPLYLSGFRIGG